MAKFLIFGNCSLYTFLEDELRIQYTSTAYPVGYQNLITSGLEPLSITRCVSLIASDLYKFNSSANELAFLVVEDVRLEVFPVDTELMNETNMELLLGWLIPSASADAEDDPCEKSI
jgi:hypothetical protein